MRNKHVGFVVEQAVHEKLRAIATREYISLSTLIYKIVKKWLQNNSLEKKKEDPGL